MNCKQGDLAVVVKTGPNSKHLLGIIVTCISIHPRKTNLGHYGWIVDKDISPFDIIEDSILLPIRDQPGEDETIQWAGLPGEIEIPCLPSELTKESI